MGAALSISTEPRFRAGSNPPSTSRSTAVGWALAPLIRVAGASLLLACAVGWALASLIGVAGASLLLACELCITTDANTTPAVGDPRGGINEFGTAWATAMGTTWTG